MFVNLRESSVHSRAKTTVSKYAYNFRRFIQWTEKYPEITSVLPADEHYVNLYLQHLVQTKSHYSTVGAAYYGIKWAHNLAVTLNPCNSPIVVSVVEAAKRKLSRPVEKKDHIDEDIMVKLYNNFYGPQITLKDLRLLTMCFLSYFGFLRYSELCSLRGCNFSFENDHACRYLYR